MSAGRLALVVLVAAAALSAAPSAKPPARTAAYPTTLPEGAAHGLARRSCLTCHSAMLVTQQRKDSTAWRKTVRQMEAWGVQLTPAESDSLVAYLSGHFAATPR